MDTFEKRLNLTQRIESNLPELFNNSILKEFGCETIVGDNLELMQLMKRPEINQSPTGMIVKFAPDFILAQRYNAKRMYFLDVKHSVTPIWYEKRLQKIRNNCNDSTIEISDIGVIAREALLSYRRFYPNTIILMASPYNPKLLMAQFADRIRCLYCYTSTNKEYDCNNCPTKNGGYFNIERATKSNGSQTPMTNVDLNSFEPIEDFFKSIEIEVDTRILETIRNDIRKEGIEVKHNDELVRNHLLWELHENGCNWIDYTIFFKDKNQYLHIDYNCKYLRMYSGDVKRCSSNNQPEQLKHKLKCKICMSKYKKDY